jgi:Alanine dehydrogenase/PNT, C-terminal domain
MTISAKNLLELMHVPGLSEAYILGCFERRVTLYSQQVRALNLVWALFHEKRLAPGDKVAVIGGGAAGLTAAAAALRLGAEVTVLEQRARILPIQQNCRQRWLHPHVYDWPAEGSLRERAGLPILDWRADYAHDVVRQLVTAWEQQGGAAKVIPDVGSIDPRGKGELAWNAEGRPSTVDHFKIIIFSVGFGLEKTEGALETLSYWDNDNLDRPGAATDVKRYLVSGCGDGGLVDVLRIRLQDFQHHKMVQRFVGSADTEALAKALNAIEEEARLREGRGELVGPYVREQYEKLVVPAEVDAAFTLRPDTTAALCSKDGNPYTLGASILNRFLVSRLINRAGVRVLRGDINKKTVKPQKKGGGFEVKFANGASEKFDHLVIRHGPTPALKRDFRPIWDAAETRFRAFSLLDQTRERLWPKGTFGPEPDPDEAKGPPAPSEPARGAVPVSMPRGLTLEDYLDQLQKTAGYVTLAGDTEKRPLGDVFVQLDITRAGAIPSPSGSRGEPKQNERAGDDDLALELGRRQEGTFGDRAKTEMIAGASLLGLACHTLIVGAAGTGKSTLIRWLSCEAAKIRRGDPAARIPIWLPRLPLYRDLEQDLAQELADRALKAVELAPGLSEARSVLTEAICSGRAVVLIDSLDEAGADEQTCFAPILAKIPGPVILASRPQLAEGVWNDVVQVTLQGIPALAAESMLKAYFPGEAWVAELLTKLRELVDSRLWMETPVLLGLAATVYRVDETLPSSTIELYDRAINHLLQSKRLYGRGEALRPVLREFAKARLLPSDGKPQVVFTEELLPAPSRIDLTRTGLFEGRSTLRFTHLSLGERLAAEADIDLSHERAKLAEANAREVEGNALEVLPMAHAIQGAPALAVALADAGTKDRADHRLLRLLLRSIGYGGEGVFAFCRTHGGEVVRLVACRMAMPSGRFGDAERKLMGSAEVAFLVLAPLVAKEEVEAFAISPACRHGAQSCSSDFDLLTSSHTLWKPWPTTRRPAR